jgi:hypothetical protein
VAEVAQAGQVFAADGCPGLDFDGDHPAVGGFQDGVYLDLVLGAVVVEPRAFLGPGELAGEFHQHECLDHGSRCSVGLAEAGGVLAEQVRGDGPGTDGAGIVAGAEPSGVDDRGVVPNGVISYSRAPIQLSRPNLEAA